MSTRRWAALAVAAITWSSVLSGATTATATAPAVGSPASTAGVEQPSRERVGQWRVERRAEGVYRLTWRSPARLPIGSDRPVIRSGSRVLGPAKVSGDGRTVRLDVRAPVRPDPASLTVMLSGDRLDVAGRDLAPQSAPATPRQGVTQLPDDPGTPGPYAVISSDYTLDPVPVRGMPKPIEMVGHVVEPARGEATGARPLVLFLHGRHIYCYDPLTSDIGFRWPCRGRFQEIPSHLGYDYIQQVLASQGYATVSVRVNGINAQDYLLNDGGAAARALIVRRHLDYWETLATDHELDLSNVVLVGHSRGGEGVARAATQIPLSDPYRLSGQVLLAPTNFGTQTTGYVPTVTVLPYCDGDVIDLQGQRYTDTARDLALDDTSLKSSVLVMGANHNFFNTEWTPGVAVAPSFDDWFGDETAPCGTATPTRLTDAEQRSVGVAYVAGAVRLFTRDAQEFLPMYDGSAVSVASTGDADVRGAAIGGGRSLRRPGDATGLTLPDGATTQFCRGVVDSGGRSSVCGRDRRLSSFQTPHWPDSGELVPTRREFEMDWTASGQSGGMVFDAPMNLTDRRLELRTIVDPRRGDADLRVRLTDAAGDTAELDPLGGPVPALPRGWGLAKRWAQALVVDPSAATSIDVAQVARVDLVSQTDSGRVWVLDVAAAPDTLVGVPDKRLPTVSLGSLRTQEGDGPGTVTAQVPFTIDGDLTTRGSLTVAVVAFDGTSRPQRRRIDLSPGQTAGSIPVTYEADTRDDYRRLTTGLFAWARFGVMTDRYDGRLVVLDDDPRPKLRVAPARRTVAEGQSARWRGTLSAPVDYPVAFYGSLIRGRTGAEPLRVGDVPRRWLREQVRRVPRASKPLYRLPIFLYAEIRPGRTRAAIEIPIRRDRVREGRESVTLEIELGGRGRVLTRTIYVAP